MWPVSLLHDPHHDGSPLYVSDEAPELGATVTVLDGWTSPDWGPTLRRLHAAACGIFGTALGPEANPLHADHLHFDMEERRSGAYCR